MTDPEPSEQPAAEPPEPPRTESMPTGDAFLSAFHRPDLVSTESRGADGDDVTTRRRGDTGQATRCTDEPSK